MAMQSLQRLGRQLGLPLDFDLGEKERGRIMRASILPGVILVAALIRFVLEAAYDFDLLAIYGILFTQSDLIDAPDVWLRVYRMAYQFGHIEYAGAAALFAAGVFAWSRAEGSWFFLIATALATVSLLGGVALAIAFLISADGALLYDDLKAVSVASFAETTGLLSIGYFFLAYRGLTSTPRRRLVRRIRREPTDLTSATD